MTDDSTKARVTAWHGRQQHTGKVVSCDKCQTILEWEQSKHTPVEEAWRIWQNETKAVYEHLSTCEDCQAGTECKPYYAIERKEDVAWSTYQSAQRGDLE